MSKIEDQRAEYRKLRDEICELTGHTPEAVNKRIKGDRVFTSNRGWLVAAEWTLKQARKFSVKRKSDNYSVNFKLVGEPQLCKEWIENLIAGYHPCGYGTRATKVETLSDGREVWTAYRATSCD
jgi:hypothetical protein